jgi:hypothetical protein
MAIVRYPIYFEKDLKIDHDNDDNTPTVSKDRAFLGVVSMSERGRDALGITGLIEWNALNETEIQEIQAHSTHVWKKEGGNRVRKEVQVGKHWRKKPSRNGRASGKSVIIEMNKKVSISTDPNSADTSNNWETVHLTFPRNCNLHHIAAWLGKYIPDSKKAPNTASDTRGAWKVAGSAFSSILLKSQADEYGVDSNQGAESPGSSAEIAALAEKRRNKNKAA